MRLRLAAAAFLCCLLLPASFAQGAPPANLTLESARLRALMLQRRDLVASLAALDAARGQALLRAALAGADTMLAADAATLRRAMVRQSTPAPSSRRAQPALPAAPPSLVAAPGVLWSPLARPIAPQALTQALSGAALTRTKAPAQPVTPPLAISLAALTSWASLLPASSAAASNSGRATRGAGSPGAAPTVSLVNPAYAAGSYGGLTLDGGSGAMPAVAANASIAAAIQTPIGSVHAATERHGASAPDLADLTRRWRAVAAALAQVRALEDWVRVAGPNAGMTPNDVIPSVTVLAARLDRWSAAPPLDPAIAAALPTFLSTPLAIAPAILGATLALTSTASSAITNDVSLSSTLSAVGDGGRVTSAAGDLPSSNAIASRINAPVTLATPAVTTTRSPDPTVHGSGRATATPGVTSDATPTPLNSVTLTATPEFSATPSLTPTIAATAIFTPAATGTATTLTPATPAPPATPLISTTPSASAALALAPTPQTGALTMTMIGGTTTLTVTTALSVAAPLSLVVTLPVTAAQALSSPAFTTQRATLESVLRQGEALYAQLQRSEAGLLRQYRRRLGAVAALNGVIQGRWLAEYDARVAYRGVLAAYRRRVANWNAYAHDIYMARLAHDAWAQRMAAWTRYAQQMAAYKIALAARRQGPISPISSTVPTQQAPPPVKPVMPPFPGPEPAPFTGAAPAWPGVAPLYAPNPGPEPAGYPLPTPPDAVPPWAGVSPTAAILNVAGALASPNAVGREETTLDALLADGALDGVPAYQDPIKGPIATYWGGQTPFQAFHPGIDIVAPEYTPIRAAAAGVVVWAGYAVAGQRHASYGLCVVIQHNAHFTTLYAHMDDQIYGLAVRVGDLVAQGQVIGYVGMTGWTTGPHLHFEMREDNIQFNPLLLVPNPQQ